MSNTVSVRSRYRARSVNTRLLRQVGLALLDQLGSLESSQIAIYIVAAREMTRLNETFLKHRGSTDVIAFDYSEPDQTGLIGEIFICLDEALIQAARFRTDWRAEIVRYLVHGTLHFAGYKDHTPRFRRRMKVQENRLLRLLANRFDLHRLGKSHPRHLQT